MALTAHVALASCTTADVGDYAVRMVAGGGVSRVTAEAGGEEGGDNGPQLSGRVEVARPVDDMGAVDVGLRVVGLYRDHDGSDDRVGIELDFDELAIAPVVRGKLAMSEGVALYGEGFVGYFHAWGDLEVRDPMGNVSSLREGGGLYGGLGIGAEFELSEGLALVTGVEWARRVLRENGPDVDLDDFTAVVGVELR